MMRISEMIEEIKFLIENNHSDDTRRELLRYFNFLVEKSRKEED